MVKVCLLCFKTEGCGFNPYLQQTVKQVLAEVAACFFALVDVKVMCLMDMTLKGQRSLFVLGIVLPHYPKAVSVLSFIFLFH